MIMMLIAILKVVVIGILIGGVGLAMEYHTTRKHHPAGKVNIFLLTLGFFGKAAILIGLLWLAALIIVV